MAFSEEELKDLMQKYKERIKQNLVIEDEPSVISRQYSEFKTELKPEKEGIYEKLCKISEKIFKITPDKKTEEALKEAIDICHLSITPTGALSFAILFPLFLIVGMSLMGFLIFGSLIVVLLAFILGLILMVVLQKMPFIIADNWRLKASNQMVLCIFYVVSYMRHTSNLELAINFAAEHLSPPLATDLKKVLWNVETQKYSSVKESLDNYLETWKKWNMEFVEAMHLIESSLYESSEDRRITALERALQLILDETYERMLHYAHNLKQPITMLHMLGIILPILGLVILPLVVNFLGNVKWYHLAVLYNVMLPIIVYYMGRGLLEKRPTGYGDVDVSETNPEYKKFSNIIIKIGKSELKISPKAISVFLFVSCFLIGLLPIIIYHISPDFVSGVDSAFQSFKFFEYKESVIEPGKTVGPYGIGASVFSLFLTCGIGISIGIYYYLSSKNLITLRNRTRDLEKEFASALFQLGNRIGDGLPVEIACQKVSETMKGTLSGKFFEIISINLQKLGMGLNQAIFDKSKGALSYFPSNMLESSMKVFVESAKKGPIVVSNALMNVSRYIKEMHSVNERLKDLLGDIISSMKTQISFITPVIAGIVVGITSMVTTIIGKLGEQLTASSGIEGEMASTYSLLLKMFGDGIPTYYFQIVVGIYVVEIIYILAILSSGIENGSDKLGEKNYIGNSLIKSSLLYGIVALAVMVMFNLIALGIMKGTGVI